MDIQDLLIKHNSVLRWYLDGDKHITIICNANYPNPWSVTLVNRDTSYTEQLDSYPCIEEAIAAAEVLYRKSIKPKTVPVTPDAVQYMADTIAALVVTKNQDYGDAWQQQGIEGVIVRLSDKAARLNNIVNRTAAVPDETVKDTMRDMAGYCLLGLLWYQHYENGGNA